ncbi:MAG: hypothetical protein WC551_02630 [Patescibacteria group bacterium]
MATNFPTSIDTLSTTRGAAGQPMDTPNHVTHHTNEDDAIGALEAKVGVDGSAVTTSLDYKLKNAASSNPGHKHTLAQGATDVTATAAELNYSAGVTSAIQDQLNAKQASDADLTAIAGLSPTNDDVIQRKAGSWINRTLAQLLADLAAFVGDSGSGGVKGLVPAPTTGDATKYLKGDGTWASPAGTGDVVGPATNTDAKVPQWNGANSKTLKDGLTLVTTVGSPGADTSIPTEKAVRSAIGAAGGGDVSGPASSTDTAIVLFDGVGGKTIKNSLATVDASGTVNIPTGQSYKVNGTALAAADVGAISTSAKGAASGVASLNGSTKVVEDPANATSTATASKIPIADGSGKLDTWISDMSDTVKGKVEAATAAETTTGTDAARAVTPDGLAGSDYGKRIVQMKIVDDATAVATGDGKLIFCIPVSLNGWNLVGAHAFVTTVSSSGAPTVQIRNVTDTVDMLSTAITIDANETTSYTAATAPVIDTTHDDVATGDLIAIDVDGAGTGAKGLGVILTFQLP